MAKVSRRNIFMGIVLLIAIAATVGYYLYNKGPLNIENAGSISITSIALYEAFSNNQQEAAKNYIGKVLAVEGSVTNVQILENKKIILLTTIENDAFVNCTMEGNAHVKKGDKIIIKGICSGVGESDPDMGIKADVYLTRCYLQQ